MSEPATGIRTVPPLLFLAMFLLAWGIHRLSPLSLGLPAGPRMVIGGLLVVVTLAAIPYFFLRFHRAGTTFETFSMPKTLVTDGLFRWSRNPGYIDLIVLGIGIAVFFDNVWVVFLMIPAIILVRQEVILKEEAILESLFGDEYRRYKARVRRWL